MRILTEKDVYDLLSMADCIEIIEQAMITAAEGKALQPPRQIYMVNHDGGAFGVMPGALGGPAAFGAKIIAVFPREAGSPYQSHQGVVIVFDPETGFVEGLVDGGAVTGIRTAAASAVATRALARKDSKVMAILGTGHQAGAHLEAMLLVRPITEIRVWGRSPERAAEFVSANFGKYDCRLTAADTVDAAVDGADIICAVSGAIEPILFGSQLAPGVHVNAVGSSVAGKRELDETAVARSRFFADLKASVLLQGGEFLRAKEAGLVGDDHILGDIGAVIGSRLEGRRSDADITVYKSLGVVAQDLAAASAVLKAAKARNIGLEAPMRAMKH